MISFYFTLRKKVLLKLPLTIIALSSVSFLTNPILHAQDRINMVICLVKILT